MIQDFNQRGRLLNYFSKFIKSVFEFNEFKPRLNSPKNRFQLSVGLKLEKLDTILSGINHIWAAV